MLSLLYISCSCLLWLLWKRKKTKTPELPPYLPGWVPIFGHTLRLIGDSNNLWKIMQRVSRETMKLGGVSTVAIGSLTGYVITDPDDCATAANACLKKNYYYNFAVPWLGDGLLTGEVSEWKRHRKIINPAFKQQVIDGFVETFNRQSRLLVHKWASKAGPFRHGVDLSLSSLEMIYETTYGKRLENEKFKNEFKTAVEDILYILTERYKKFWFHFEFIYKFSNLKKKQDKVIEVLHRITESMVEEKRKNKQNNDGFRSILDVMIEASDGKDYCNDKDLREDVDNIIFGGYDTVSFTLVITLIILGSYEDVQNKTYKEIHNIFGDSDRDVVKDDLKRMPYLEAVLKETLRLYPVAPVIARYVDTDVKLKNYTMKVGSSCYLLFKGIHLHEAWGPDAEQFRPERWLEPNERNPNLFTAFSVGKRACIGKTYALMHMKIMLIHLLRSFRCEADISKAKFKLDVLLKLVENDDIILHRRRK